MISIIIPVYNIKQYLSECLDSILSQTVTDWEAILVDDGSTDGSSEICDIYAANDKRFKVIHQENAGAANAKNKALDNATGDFIAFVDSDDIVEQNWLEVLLQNIKDVDVVEYGFDKLHPWGMSSYDLLQPNIFKCEDYLNQYTKYWPSSLFCNKFFRSELLKNIRFPTARRCIDDEFFTYKVIANATTIKRISNVLYHYRQRISSAMGNQSNALQRTNDAHDFLKERYFYITERFPKLKKTYLQHAIESLHFFAQTFPFDSESCKKFVKLRRFYLKELIFSKPDLHSFIDGITLIRFTKKKLLKNTVKKNEINEKDYFI